MAADLVQDAIDELYALDPDDFMDRRTALTAAARAIDKAAAKDIGGLRKPTRSAWALNQLVRSDPDAAQRLADLGDGLRAAQEALDGPRMRELSTLRRGMVEELADQAFQVVRQGTVPPGLRDEVVSTLNAAVADEGVVEQLRTGTLLRPARWDGFGFASPPELSVLRPAAPRRDRAQAGTSPSPARPGVRTGQGAAKPGASGAARKAGASAADRRASAATTQAAAKASAKAEAKAEEQRRRQALSAAQRTVKEADSALAKAIKVEDEQQQKVRILHEQLTDARRRLDEIRIDVRRAENRQGKAQHALERAQK